MSHLPAAGEGRGRLADHKQLRLGVLRGLARWMERQAGPDGALRCRRHRVEHTGKNVYSALLHLELWRYTREPECLEVARQVVLRTVSMLGEDPGSHVPVFLPGRVDPANASTNAIDGGACADTLATVLDECPQMLEGDEVQRVREALQTHVEGYLRHAARERPITAQRLWAGTGVARAARLLDRDDWRADALAGCRLALEELSPDGVAPYIPEHTDHCTHEGLADTSTFYHSRTPAFILYVHDVLGEPLDDFARERLCASLDALLAMRDGNGRKVLHNEAKAWYWEGGYEVASHPFDAYALHTGARLLERPDYALAAGGVMEEWIAHLSPLDGAVESHHGPGVDFQCQVFWTGHAAWAARVLADVPVRSARGEPRDIDLAASGLLHVERPRYTAVLRGARRRNSNLFGCDAGGGTLQSLVVHGPHGGQGEELAARPRFEAQRPGSFLVRAAGSPGRLARWRALLSSQRSDLRFRLFVASVEWGAGRWLGALLYPFRHGLRRTLADASPWFAAHRDTGTSHTYDGQEAVFRGGVADWDGVRLPGVETERRYRFEQDGVLVIDVAHVHGVRGTLRYRFPEAMQDAAMEGEGGDVRHHGRAPEFTVTADHAVVRVTGRYAC